MTESPVETTYRVYRFVGTGVYCVARGFPTHRLAQQWAINEFPESITYESERDARGGTAGYFVDAFATWTGGRDDDEQ